MLQEAESAIRRWFVGLALLVLTFLLILFFFRFISLALLLLTGLLYLRFCYTDRRRALYATWALSLVSLLSPIDVTLLDVPGPPRLVPLLMGLPNGEMLERQRRGDAVLGGCLVSGYEPKYVVVW